MSASRNAPCLAQLRMSRGPHSEDPVDLLATSRWQFPLALQPMVREGVGEMFAQILHIVQNRSHCGMPQQLPVSLFPL